MPPSHDPVLFDGKTLIVSNKEFKHRARDLSEKLTSYYSKSVDDLTDTQTSAISELRDMLTNDTEPTKNRYEPWTRHEIVDMYWNINWAFFGGWVNPVKKIQDDLLKQEGVYGMMFSSDDPERIPTTAKIHNTLADPRWTTGNSARARFLAIMAHEFLHVCFTKACKCLECQGELQSKYLANRSHGEYYVNAGRALHKLFQKSFADVIEISPYDTHMANDPLGKPADFDYSRMREL